MWKAVNNYSVLSTSLKYKQTEPALLAEESNPGQYRFRVDIVASADHTYFSKGSVVTHYKMIFSSILDIIVIIDDDYGKHYCRSETVVKKGTAVELLSYKEVDISTGIDLSPLVSGGEIYLNVTNNVDDLPDFKGEEIEIRVLLRIEGQEMIYEQTKQED